jgi:hypothetical protein
VFEHKQARDGGFWGLNLPVGQLVADNPVKRQQQALLRRRERAAGAAGQATREEG